MRHAIGAALEGAQARRGGAQRALAVPRRRPLADDHLEIAVEVLIGIEFGRLRRQIEEGDAVGVRDDPPTPAARPDSRLLRETFGLELSRWRVQLAQRMDDGGG